MARLAKQRWADMISLFLLRPECGGGVLAERHTPSDTLNIRLRELDREMPVSSSKDTQVVAQLQAGKTARIRAEVIVSPILCLCADVFQHMSAIPFCIGETSQREEQAHGGDCRSRGQQA